MSIGERIKSARIMAGFSQRALAHIADVSAMAISKYERDMDVPSSSVLLRLAKALGVKIEYFFRPGTVTLSTPIHRQWESLPAQMEASLLEHVQDRLERYIDIEQLLDCTPQSPMLPSKRKISTLENCEDVACDLRRQWQLGLGPLKDLIEICEDHGIKVELLDRHAACDALTLWANDTIPVILLRRGISGDKQRFSLAHELGYLILDPDAHIDPEQAANRFAGAFLAPRSAVELELGTKRQALNLYELHLLKHKYGLSMQAWIHRAKDLGIISKATADQMFKQFSQQGWCIQEPGDALPPEEPHRFQRLVLHALSEGIISRARSAELLGEPLSHFIEGAVELDGGWSFELCS